MYALMGNPDEPNRRNRTRCRDESRCRKDEATKQQHCHEKTQEPVLSGCFCDRPLRALKPDDVNLFLPRCMPCTCGRRSGSRSTFAGSMALRRILRPWQAEFLKNEYMITTTAELVSSYSRIGPLMAKGMAEWWKESSKGKSTQDVESCALALHIWNRTCEKIIDAANSGPGVFIYELIVREVMEKTLEIPVPKFISVPALEVAQIDDVSDCSSQGATTVLEEFLEQIFANDDQIGLDDDDSVQDILNCQSSCGSTDSNRQVISNMSDVVVSMDFYKRMDEKLSPQAQERHAARMSSVLSKLNIELITTGAKLPDNGNDSTRSLAGSPPSVAKSFETETTHSIMTSITEEKEKKNTMPPAKKAANSKTRRKSQWHCSLNYLATFDEEKTTSRRASSYL